MATITIPSASMINFLQTRHYTNDPDYADENGKHWLFSRTNSKHGYLRLDLDHAGPFRSICAHRLLYRIHITPGAAETYDILNTSGIYPDPTKPAGLLLLFVV